MAPILGAVGGGIVFDTFGSRAMFLAASVLVTAAAVTALFVVPSPAAPRPRESAKPAPEVLPGPALPAPEVAPATP